LYIYITTDVTRPRKRQGEEGRETYLIKNGLNSTVIDSALMGKSQKW